MRNELIIHILFTVSLSSGMWGHSHASVNTADLIIQPHKFGREVYTNLSGFFFTIRTTCMAKVAAYECSAVRGQINEGCLHVALFASSIASAT